MQRPVGREPLNRYEFAAVGLRGQHQARRDQPPVDEHRAGAAVASAAAFLGAGVTERFANCLKHRPTGLDRDFLGLAIDAQVDDLLGHTSILSPVRRLAKPFAPLSL